MSIQIGAIGLGGLAHVELDHLDAVDGVDIIAGADIEAEACDLFQATFGGHTYQDYENLLAAHADVLDAVLIVTPHTLHYEQATACLEQDIDVFVEKPMVTALDAAEDLVQLANDRDRIIQVGYQRRFDPIFREFRRMVLDEVVGPVHTISCALGQEWITQHTGTWRTDPELAGGGQLYDSGSHILDALLWITAGEPTTVSASVTFDVPEIDVNSAVTVDIAMERGNTQASVTICGDGVAPDPYEQYTVWGKEGRMTLTRDRIRVSRRGEESYHIDMDGAASIHALTRNKLEHFVAAIQGEAEPAVPGEAGLQVTALTEAIYEAERTGCASDVIA